MPFYSVPAWLIGDSTLVVVKGSETSSPNLYLHWTRSYVQTTGVANSIGAPWWQSHIVAVTIIAITYLLSFGLILAWAIGEIRRGVTDVRAIVALAISFGALVIASLVTTNYDLQLFKGLAEGYWVNGPLPALTINGYGPLIDIIFTVPVLPYLLLAGLLGGHSELALNLAIRLPFLLGWLLLVACTARLTRSLQLKDARGSIRSRRLSTYRLPWLLLILNPLILVIALWQPEALLVALVLLSFALLFEGRVVLAGVFLGVAFAGKYWPVIVGPWMLIAAWRLFGRAEATKFLSASTLTVLGIFAIYWLPTAALLRSPAEFGDLLISRMPYFGGSHAAVEATIWSLYEVPVRLLPGPLGNIVAVVEQRASLVFVAIYAGIVILCLQGVLTRRGALLAAGASLALLAGLNSLTVPQFALWSLPFMLLVGGGSARRPTFVWLGVGASWCGFLVFVFAEPISYWLLHVSGRQDDFAHSAAAWLLIHVVSVPLARVLGFFFAVLLVSAAANMIAELAIGTNPATRLRPTTAPAN
jgi:hypothetical protein